MPIIDRLRLYPVAGVPGFDVKELTVTPEAIQGDRSFAIVLESEFAEILENPEHRPVRLSQLGTGQQTPLTQFRTQEENGKLVIIHNGKTLYLNQELNVGPSDRPFYAGEEVSDISSLLANYALPVKASRSSESDRWVVDCGRHVADWLSAQMGMRVRLVKAVEHPSAKKHHFTWYTDIHAITQASLARLAEETGIEVDELTFRYNVLLSETEAYEEEKWKTGLIKTVEASLKIIIRGCRRCGYVGIEQATGLLHQYMGVVNTIAKQHGVNFGVYLVPQGDSFKLILRVGDEIEMSNDE